MSLVCEAIPCCSGNKEKNEKYVGDALSLAIIEYDGDVQC